ncbi:MAG: hypothetical protein ACREF4_10735 [Gammaproteobacteria bacterium]
MMRDWLRSLRQRPPAPAAEIRQELAGLRHQHAETIARRDAMALDAVQSDEVAEQYQQLDAEASELARQIQMLEAALPRADAREAEAARQAEADAHAKRLDRHRQQTAEAQRWLDAVLARLPSGEELTAARNLRDALRAEANGLSRRSQDVAVRRPLDPLDATYCALKMRVQRIERARWIHGDHPITLLTDPRASERTGTND